MSAATNITQQPVDEVVSITGLYKSFGENHVLRNFSVGLKRGENLVVLGKSGSGKSVLIKCIIGLIHPEQGSIKAFGQELVGMKREPLDKMRVRIGFLFQSNALYDSMTIRENLEFPLRRHGKERTREAIDALVEEALSNVGLRHTIDMMPSELSGGMRKRIALARWLTAPENPHFARNFANRIWAHFLGRGLVEPVDDLRVSNPPTNKPLLDALGLDVVILVKFLGVIQLLPGRIVKPIQQIIFCPCQEDAAGIARQAARLCQLIPGAGIQWALDRQLG